MKQCDLNRAVANKTGESITEVSRRGFVPLEPVPFERDPEDLIIDWDDLEADRAAHLASPPYDLSAVA